MALGLSMREHRRRKYAPNADLLLRGAAAARRNACEARLTTRLVFPLITLPPVILVPGHSPNQEVKCLTVGNRVISTPISETRRQRGGDVDAVDTGEVDAAHLEQLRAQIELRRVACPTTLLDFGGVAVVKLEALQLQFDLAVAFGQLRADEVATVRCERLRHGYQGVARCAQCEDREYWQRSDSACTRVTNLADLQASPTVPSGPSPTGFASLRGPIKSNVDLRNQQHAT